MLDKHRPRGPDAPQSWALLQGGASGWLGSVGDPRALPRSESAHARGGPWWGRLAYNQTSTRKGAGPEADTPRRAATEGVSGRAEFPARSPASRVPWSRPPPLPCWIVRLLPPPLPPPPPEDWRSREFSAAAGVRGQRPSGPSRAGREPRASLSVRGPRAPAVSSFPRPPRAGGATGCCVCDCRLAPLSPRVGLSARPPLPETALDAPPHRRHHELGPAAPAEGHQRGLPAAHPARERVSLLLPRQEMCGQ